MPKKSSQGSHWEPFDNRPVPPERGARPGQSLLDHIIDRHDNRNSIDRLVGRTESKRGAAVPKVPRKPGGGRGAVPLPLPGRLPLPKRFPLPGGLPGPWGLPGQVGDLIDNWAKPPGGAWPADWLRPYLERQCVAVPMRHPNYGPVEGYIYFNGNVNGDDCGLDGQATSMYPLSQFWGGGFFPNGIQDTIVLLQQRCEGCSPNPKRYAEVWYRNIPGPMTAPAGPDWYPAPALMPLPMTAGGPEPDPNGRRGPAPVPEPQQPPAGMPMPGMSTDPVGDTFAPGQGRGYLVWPGTAPQVQPDKPRGPPTKYENEGKYISWSSRFLIRFAQMMDKVSEGAEVVDAMYEALPESTKRKWDCDRKAPFIDQAGQYGVDNADCKARALFHNLHKMDIEKAVRGIIENELEDKLYGAIHRKLPRQTGAALDESFRVLADLLSELKSWYS